VTGIPLRTIVRDSAFRIFRRAGLLGLAGRSNWRARRLLILCYHGFSQKDEHLWNPELYVSGTHLEQRLRILAAEGYTILALGEGLARLQSGTLPPRAVTITVDDGNYDFYAVAYPILKRWGVPATVYVSTFYVFDHRPVFDVTCSYLLWKGLECGPLLIEDPDGGPAHSIRTPADSSVVVARIREIARRKAWTADQKHDWLGGLATMVGLDWQGFLEHRLLALMNPQELRALDPAIADVQLHTHRHRVPEDRDLFLREIRDNRNALADCGFEPSRLVHFCYPSGVHRPAFLPWLAEANVVSAVTGIPGLASGRDNRFLLPRFIDTTRTSDVEFEGWASGFRQFVHRPTRIYAVGA
jgi:peptidoglycan/xylan/chitin deacetylase (PgdA/CDA1 family)